MLRILFILRGLGKVPQFHGQKRKIYLPAGLAVDAGLSSSEKRYRAIGRTSRGRLLFVAYTVRHKLIRVISTREMNRREIEEYKRHEEGS
jgi:uncharacterized DUF497 family protein